MPPSNADSWCKAKRPGDAGALNFVVLVDARASVQLAAEIADASSTSLAGGLRRRSARLQDLLGGGNRIVDGRGAHLGDGLSLGAGDLLLGRLRAPLDLLGQRLAGLRGQASASRLACSRISLASFSASRLLRW